MVTAINPKIPFDFVLGEGIEAVTFRLKPLTAAENAQTQNLLAANKPGDADLYVLECGLVTWAGLKTEAGAIVPFPTGKGEAADLLPREVRITLAARILIGKANPPTTSTTKRKGK